jgi:hypothetical protein
LRREIAAKDGELGGFRARNIDFHDGIAQVEELEKQVAAEKSKASCSVDLAVETLTEKVTKPLESALKRLNLKRKTMSSPTSSSPSSSSISKSSLSDTSLATSISSKSPTAWESYLKTLSLFQPDSSNLSTQDLLEHMAEVSRFLLWDVAGDRMDGLRKLVADKANTWQCLRNVADGVVGRLRRPEVDCRDCKAQGLKSCTRVRANDDGLVSRVVEMHGPPPKKLRALAQA